MGDFSTGDVLKWRDDLLELCRATHVEYAKMSPNACLKWVDEDCYPTNGGLLDDARKAAERIHPLYAKLYKNVLSNDSLLTAAERLQVSGRMPELIECKFPEEPPWPHRVRFNYELLIRFASYIRFLPTHLEDLTAHWSHRKCSQWGLWDYENKDFASKLHDILDVLCSLEKQEFYEDLHLKIREEFSALCPSDVGRCDANDNPSGSNISDDDKMLLELRKNSERFIWGIRDWATFLERKSHSGIPKLSTWNYIMKWREENKIECQEMQERAANSD